MNSTNYVYAGAARYLGASSGGRGGLFRLAVGENTWQSLDAGMPEEAEVRCIAIHPGDPSIVYAGTQHGPYRSQDAGDSWEALPFHDSVPNGDLPAVDRVVWSFLFEPDNPDVVYAGTAPSAIYKSENGGRDWQALPIIEPSGAVQMGFPTRVVRLVAGREQPGTIYAAIEVGGVIRSADGGASWEDCSQGLLQLAEREHLKSQIGSDSDTEGMVDAHALAIGASRPETVFLATRMGLFTSSDRGNAWEEMGIGKFSPLTYARDVKVSAHNPETLFAALSGAAFSDSGSLFVSRDSAASWARYDHGIDITSTMMIIAESAESPERLFCGGRGGQVIGTLDGGSSWMELPMPDGVQDVYALACH